MGGGRRSSSSFRRAGALATACAIAGPLLFVATGPGLGAPTDLVGSVTASHASPVPSDNPRPAGCTAQNGDPNAANDGATPSPLGTFPWPGPPAGTSPEDYSAYLHTGGVGGFPERPANWSDGGGSWKLTSARTTNATVAENPQELCGVQGNRVDAAWETSTGRPDTVIAITDSGIEWCTPSIVDKVALNRGALPYPEDSSGRTKPQLEALGLPGPDGAFADGDPYDLDNSGVLNAAQYSADPRVAQVTASSVSKGLFCGSYVSPEDLIRTFGDPASTWYYPVAGASGAEQPSYPGQEPPGFTEAIAGWNFLDDTNDPFDDVSYGHGTGEAGDSTGAADSTDEVGTCPDCMVLPIRVGESFIAEGNDFARGVLFAVDSGASLVQEALGSIDVTTTAAQAIAYANAHGVPVVASAADEEAEHHNEPGNLPGTIVVNSVTDSPSESVGGQSVSLLNPPGYLFLNGCTNYGANIGVSVESASCSSEATGKTGGVAGLIESEAADLLTTHGLTAYPGLSTATGHAVGLSSTEVRELIEMSADDVDFQSAVVPSLSDLATTLPEPPDNYAVVSPVPTTRYPTQPGYDMYSGYGRLDAARALSWLRTGKIPPEASFGEMQWFQSYDPTTQSVPVPVDAAAVRTPGTYHWTLQYGIGTQPEPGDWTDVESGTGTGGPGGSPTKGTVTLGPSLLRQIAAQLPPSDNGTGPAGRPEPDADAFTLRLVVTDAHGLVGLDRRTEYLVHDPALLTGTVVEPAAGAGTATGTEPATAIGGSVDGAPTLAPIGPNGTDALVVPTADGIVHAYTPVTLSGGGIRLQELPGWPVRTALLPGQAQLSAVEPAYRSGAVTAAPRCTIVGGVAVGRLVPGGGVDVVGADMCGNVYAWSASGTLLAGFPVHTTAAFSRDPSPYAGTTAGPVPSVDPRDEDNRLMPGILPTPVLADLTGSGRLDIVASSLDRHVYAWDPSGSQLAGYPVLVLDPSVVSSVDPVTNHVTFKAGVDVQQGTAIIDAPAVGRLRGGSGPPDLVVGTNAEYGCNPATVPGLGLQERPGDPPCAISVVNALNFGAAAAVEPLLDPANSPLFALGPAGTDTPPTTGATDCADGTAQPDACAILPGWPAKMTDLDAGLLPTVGDGTSASPALADLSGNGTLVAGDSTAVGPAYLFGPSGSSYLGTGPDGQPIALSMSAVGPLSNSPVVPSIPGLGMPVFAPLGNGAPGISYVSPAASIGKALDAALPDQQVPNDTQLDAWNIQTATMQPAFPQVMNDLEFFDQPIVANVGGTSAGPYVVEGSANGDLRALDGLGLEAPGFPKFTGGWVVNSPSFGPFGTLGTQVLVAGTRDGDLFVWSTPTPRCSPSGPWPREHHDLSNTNDLAATSALPPACKGRS